MIFKFNFLQIGLLATLIFNILGSLSSRIFAFDYSYLTPLSAIIYCSIGFITTKEFNLKMGTRYTTLMGLFDSTIGWMIAILLKANTGTLNIQPYSIELAIIVVISMTVLASLLGLISGGVALLLKKKAISNI